VTQTEQSWQWYDDNASVYEEMDPATVEFGRQLVEYADPPPGARLLDVGAGRGAVVRHALARGCAVTAVDAAPAMVARLLADFPDVLVSTMDAHRFDFPDGCFDAVIAGFVLDLLPDPAAALREMRRVLAPGGLVALSVPGVVPHRERWSWLADLAREYFPGAVADDLEPSAPLPLAELLAAAGFGGVAGTDFRYPGPIAGPAALWELFSARLPTAVSAGWVEWLPAERAAEFRRRFLAGAERMHGGGGISFDRHVIMYRATAPA